MITLAPDDKILSQMIELITKSKGLGSILRESVGLRIVNISGSEVNGCDVTKQFAA
jgi:hypothetical protein